MQFLTLPVHTLRKLSYLLLWRGFCELRDTGNSVATCLVISVNIMVVLSTFDSQQVSIHNLAFLFTMQHAYPSNIVPGVLELGRIVLILATLYFVANYFL